MSNLMRDEVEREAFNKAIRFIRHRPRSRGEVLDKLSKLEYEEETRNRVVEQLVSRGLVNDNEFACRFKDEMIGKGYGYRRIENELLKKKVERATIREAMADYPFDKEVERACCMVRDKVRKMSQEEPETKMRKIRSYLLRLGYSRDSINEACKQLRIVDTNTGREYNEL